MSKTDMARAVELLQDVLDGEMSDRKAQEEFGGYILDEEISQRIRAFLESITKE